MVRLHGTAIIRAIVVILIGFLAVAVAGIVHVNRSADAGRRRDETTEKLLQEWHPEARDFGWTDR